MGSKVLKKLIAATAAIGISFTLTACDPPMPPDVAAQILEQTFTCEPGELTIQSPENMSDVVSQWADGMQTSCVDPLPPMAIKAANAGDSTDLLVSSDSDAIAQCKPSFSVPFALDAGAVGFQLTDSSTLNLEPKTIAAILTGKITNWDDAKIAADNEGTTFPSMTIKIRKTADPLALKSFSSWMKNLKQDISSVAIQPAAGDQVDSLAEGEIAIMPNSRVMELGLYSVAIIQGVDPKTGDQLLALADQQGIASAGSQLKVKKSPTSPTVSLDPKIAPVAQAGFDEAAPPYQAIFPIYLTACGEDSLLKRAGSLYLLRLDSQGVFGASNYNPLPEQVRFESLSVARKGLPTPSALPAQ